MLKNHIFKENSVEQFQQFVVSSCRMSSVCQSLAAILPARECLAYTSRLVCVNGSWHGGAREHAVQNVVMRLEAGAQRW